MGTQYITSDSPCGVTGYRVGDPFKWDVFSTAGVSTGISLAYIALNWKYMIKTFNVVIGRLRRTG